MLSVENEAAARARHKVDVAPDGSIVTVSSIVGDAECGQLVRMTEEVGYGDAPITTYRGFVMRPDVRNNTRVMLDDHELARRLWERIRPFVPSRMGAWSAVGVNERFRFYRYDAGQYFKWHGDGAFVRSTEERSLITAMIYLNDDFSGGSTDFSDGPRVAPRRGMLLLFHHELVHQGATVQRGRKYVMRTDVMYRLGRGRGA